MNHHDPSIRDDASSIRDGTIMTADARVSQSTTDRAETALRWSIEDLLQPDAFPHEVSELQIRETHISWVILTGSFAYKIKKPVKLDFIDASTVERRRHYCEEELRLNRRLAPELYVDLVTITLKEGRAFIGAADGPAVEYAVRMRQFPAHEELPALLAEKNVDAAQIAALGQLLAEFHLNAAVAPAKRAPESTEQMLDAVFGNLTHLLGNLGSVDQQPDLNHLRAWTRDTAIDLEPTFHLREREGFVREGHGDLHAANIVRHNGRLVPFDCIEFDGKLRWIDVIDDIAFLVMDLMCQERADLATVLLSRYLEVTGDYDGMRLLPFYAAYRALVRARVDALAAISIPTRASEFRQRLERRLRAAASWTKQRQPALILMHGASGSGKSWLSTRLAPEIAAIRLRSDLERKRLAHLGPTQSAAAGVREGIYSPPFSHRTYGRLADNAEQCLRVGFNVIVDASFLEATNREMFQALALRLGVPCMIVSCQSDPIDLAEHILDRTATGMDPSDATLAVLDAQLREFEAFGADEQPSVMAVDTQTPNVVHRVVQEIRTRCAI